MNSKIASKPITPQIQPITFHQQVSGMNHHIIQNDSQFSGSNTQLVVQELLSSGYTASKLAEEVGVATSTISRLGRGLIRRTKSALFTKLIALHCNVFSEKR